jgi:hypothetical protein
MLADRLFVKLRARAGMVIDYRDTWHAIRARRALEAAGIVVRSTPNKLVAVSTDPLGTLCIVHRLEVSAADSRLARTLLDRYNLWPAPNADVAN